MEKNDGQKSDGKDISGYAPGDRVRMKKPHPCGSTDWEILRLGADVWLVCCKCGRQVIMERETFYKRAKGAREQLKRNMINLEAGKNLEYES